MYKKQNVFENRPSLVAIIFNFTEPLTAPLFTFFCHFRQHSGSSSSSCVDQTVRLQSKSLHNQNQYQNQNKQASKQTNKTYPISNPMTNPCTP